MDAQPQRRTARLHLRAYLPADEEILQRLVDERRVAETTANIPHPYPPGAAAEWIASRGPAWAQRKSATCALARLEDGAFVGAVGLELDLPNGLAELGYWIGLPYWGLGYATEAARAMLDIGFADLALARVQARYMLKNPASGRVMQKAGMRFERRYRAVVRGMDEEVAMHGLAREDWAAGRADLGL